MGEVKLFRAKIHGERWVGFFDMEGDFTYIVPETEDTNPEFEIVPAAWLTELTDLTELELHDKGSHICIELTEYDRINIETAMKTMSLPVPLAEIVAKLYNAIQSLSPQPVEEPKEFGAVVEAFDGYDQGSGNPKLPFVYSGTFWHHENLMRSWSDLIDPRVIGGEK